MTSRARAFQIARIVALVVLLAALAYALSRNFHAVSKQIRVLSVGSLIGSEVAVLTAITATMLAWRALLADLGAPISRLAGARIFFLGQLGKYVPGSVWPVVMQMELGAAMALPRAAVATASLLGIGFGLGAGAGLALLTAPAVLTTGAAWQWLLPPLGVIILGCLCIPGPMTRGVVLALRLTRRKGLTPAFTSRGLAAATLWSAISWVLLGVHVRILAGALGSTYPNLWALSIGAMAVSVCAGLVVVLAPAGAGVRDVLLIALLAPALSSAAATALALVSRLLFSIADLLVALYAIATTRQLRSRQSAG